METHDFLSAVLPTEGKYCTFIQKGAVRKNIFVSTLENLYNTNVQFSTTGSQTYYAMAAFDDAGSREAVHAQHLRSIFIDLDCGSDAKTGKPKAFASKRAAVTALYAFLQATKLDALGTPWLVDSGGGVHVYFPLCDDVPVARWKPLAEAFKRAAVRHAFPIDASVTADAARVLRCPGTLNWKYEPARPVTLKQRGSVYTLEALEASMVAYQTTAVATRTETALAIPGARPNAAITPVAKALLGSSVTYFKNIMVRTAAGTGCAQVQYYVDHAAEDGVEPLWRAMLSLAKPCIDGAKAARKLSAMHPYDESRMMAKLDAIKGPYSCVSTDSINPGVCPTCPHWGKITNALALGREIQTTVAPVVYASVVGVPETQRPEPPWGFSYGVNGGLCYQYKATKKDEVDHDIMLLPYDFFMTHIFADANERVAEFKAIKGDKVYTLGIPLAKATNHADCVKALAAENIIASSIKNEAYLTLFVRQSIVAASAIGQEVAIPPRFGWLEGGDFALCDRVISQHGPEHDYYYKSSRLGNLIEMTRPSGTLAEWRKPFEMLRRKELWGHLAFATVGFASILMNFMPAGARAVTAHIAGRGTGNGKTYAAAMSNSIWGEPRRYAVPPETSRNTMMQRAGLLGSLHLGVDEITDKQRSTDREFIPQIVFAYSAGVHKIKGSNASNSEIRNDLFWSGILELTSNTTALEAMMGARGTTSEGEARRMLEWAVPKTMSMTWDAQDERDAQAINTNYGVAGVQFAEWCVTHQDTVRTVCEDSLKLWRQYANAPGTERFWSNGCAASIAAIILLGPEHANVLTIPASKIMDFWLTQVVEPSRKIIDENQLTAHDVLMAYIRENNHNFIRVSANVVINSIVGGGDVAENNRRQVRGRVELDIAAGLESTFVEVALLRQHCASRNIGYTEFITELQAAGGISNAPRKNLTAGTTGAQMRVACIKLVRQLPDEKRAIK